MEQLQAWVSRLQVAVDNLDVRFSEHSQLPWHAGFEPLFRMLLGKLDDSAKMIREVRLDLKRATFAVIGILLSILGALVAILWQIVVVSHPLH